MGRQRSAILIRFAELLNELQQWSGDESDEALHALVESAAAFLPGAQYAGIGLVTSTRRVETSAATHPCVVTLDAIERDHREGPCLSASWESQVVRVDDLEAERRWSCYCRDAIAATPVRSVLSLRLSVDSANIGALNFYADDTHVFDEDSVELGLVFATHTALVWNMLRRDAQFRSALASRDIIGQAKGMLMERFDIDALRAFDLLKRLSQDSNTPLAEVARRLIDADHPVR